MSVTSRRPTARFIAGPIPIAVMAIVLTLGVHALALGHAVVWPKTSTAGGRERYVIRVPNERNVSTTRVEIQFPADVRVTGFIDVPGWRLEVVRDSAKRITGAVWTGDLPPERFAEFTFTATNPKDATAIVWPVLQRYADGENADWTGPAGSTRPASSTTLAAVSAMTDSGAAAPAPQPANQWISYAALGVSILSLGIALRRRDAAGPS